MWLVAMFRHYAALSFARSICGYPEQPYEFMQSKPVLGCAGLVACLGMG